MSITIENIDETRRSVTIVITSEQIKQEEQNILKGFVKQAKIPGFRPGRAPINMIKAKYSKAIKDELQQKVSSKAYELLIKEDGQDIYSLVDIKLPEVSTDANVSVVFLFDVRPDIQLPDYKGLTVNVSKKEITEEEVQKAIDNVRSQRAEYKIVEVAASKGDYTKFSYEGKIDGKPVAEILPENTIYGKQESTWEEAGAENVPGVRAVIDALVGMKPEDETEVTMDFPADFQEAELAGKRAVYSVKVDEVRQKVLPEMDEEFFKSIDVKGLEAFRERVRTELQNRRRQEESAKAHEQILDQISKNVTVKVPESAIEEQQGAILRDYMKEIMKQGMPQERLEEKKEELLAQARQAGEARAKTLLILEEIANKEDIKLEDKDLNMPIMQEAMMAGMKPDEFVNKLKKDRKRLEKIRQNALANKVLDFLRQEAKFEDTEAEI